MGSQCLWSLVQYSYQDIVYKYVVQKGTPSFSQISSETSMPWTNMAACWRGGGSQCLLFAQVTFLIGVVTCTGRQWLGHVTARVVDFRRGIDRRRLAADAHVRDALGTCPFQPRLPPLPSLHLRPSGTHGYRVLLLVRCYIFLG